MNVKGAYAIALGVLVFVAGAGTAAMTLRSRPEAPKPIVRADCDDGDDELASANASLVKSLQECNRRLAQKGEREVVVASATASSPTAPPQGGRRGRGGRDNGPPDWQKLAEEGVVPYQIPCIRATPFVPTERQLDRLGLAPHDGDVIKQAYAKSNARMNEQLAPLCATVLGSKDVAERVGAQACMTAIVESSRRQDADKMKAALTRVAEVNGGKRSAPTSTEGMAPVEAMMIAMTREARAFEQDLSAQLGPEEAARIASSRGLCSERGVVRATDAPPREGPPRDGR